MENIKRKQNISKESKNKKLKIESVTSLLLSITYGLNETNSKLIVIGYHPNTILPAVILKDINHNVSICLDHEEATKLFDNMNEINKSVRELSREHQKSEFPCITFDITKNLFVRITADALNLIYDKEDCKCFKLITKEFKALNNFASFLKFFVEKYTQTDKNQVVKLLAEDSENSDADSQYSVDSYEIYKLIAVENGDSFSEDSDYYY